MADCAICKRQNDRTHVVFESSNWIVRHSTETNILGYFILESRRHFLDMSEANEDECLSYGVVLSQLQAAMKQVVDAQRIYTFSLGEVVAHYHLHVVPRRSDFPRAYRGRGILSYPLSPGPSPSLVDEICDRVRRAMSRIGRNQALTSPLRLY